MEQETGQRSTKQVIVIRRDLRMRRGKEIAQGAHASMAWLRERIIERMAPAGAVDHLQLSAAEQAWFERSFRKVTVKVGSEAELLAVYGKALEAGLTAHLITDRGLTEFGGDADPDLPRRRPGLRRAHRPGDRRPRAVLTGPARGRTNTAR